MCRACGDWEYIGIYFGFDDFSSLTLILKRYANMADRVRLRKDVSKAIFNKL